MKSGVIWTSHVLLATINPRSTHSSFTSSSTFLLHCPILTLLDLAFLSPRPPIKSPCHLPTTFTFPPHPSIPTSYHSTFCSMPTYSFHYLSTPSSSIPLFTFLSPSSAPLSRFDQLILLISNHFFRSLILDHSFIPFLATLSLVFVERQLFLFISLPLLLWFFNCQPLFPLSFPISSFLTSFSSPSICLSSLIL